MSGTHFTLEERQARILAIVRELRNDGVPEPVLAPILRFACVDMWSTEE